MRLIGKKSTYFPGLFSLKLCPNFLAMISKPKRVICVTGTNGKTSTTNMLADCLIAMDKDLVYNKLGSNMAEGIVSSLLQFGTSFWGSCTKEIGLFEVDERSSQRVYSQMQPDYIIVTNLFRDTIRREANTDFVFDIMDSAIPPKSKLVLNADDIISSRLASENDRIYFSVARLEGEEECRNSLVNDAVYDFDTGKAYEYSFLRYHHIGRIKDFSPEPDYTISSFDKQSRAIELEIKGKQDKENYTLISKNETDLYNQLAALALLRDMGYSEVEVNKGFSGVKVIESRYEESEVNGKKVILFLSKGCASVAASRVVKYVADYPGNTALILMNEEEYKLSYYNSWFYEIDYKPLISEHIKQIVIGGYYCKDFHLCLLLQGVDESKISSQFKHLHTAETVDLSAVDNVFVVYGLDTIVYKDDIKKRLIERIEELK